MVLVIMVFDISTPIYQNGTIIGTNTKPILNLLFESGQAKKFALGLGIGSFALFGLVIYFLLKKK